MILVSLQICVFFVCSQFQLYSWADWHVFCSYFELSINLQVEIARSSERVLKSSNKKMSEKEQRIHPRRQVRWSVSILAANGLRRGETEDISLGGAFIRCEKPPRPNEKVLLTFEDWSSSMRVFAQVAWTNLASEDSRDKPTGMGVQFLQFLSTSRPVERAETSKGSSVQPHALKGP
jgi:Tfp pilus assembly protein PilZ